jgi:hypothetical protein
VNKNRKPKLQSRNGHRPTAVPWSAGSKLWNQSSSLSGVAGVI